MREREREKGYVATTSPHKTQLPPCNQHPYNRGLARRRVPPPFPRPSSPHGYIFLEANNFIRTNGLYAAPAGTTRYCYYRITSGRTPVTSLAIFASLYRSLSLSLTWHMDENGIVSSAPIPGNGFDYRGWRKLSRSENHSTRFTCIRLDL